MTNNDIVINKLTQILSYLRHSKRDLKRQKKKGIGIFSNLEQEMNIKPSYESMSTVTNKAKDISIYDDIGDYIPDTKRRSAPANESKKKVYFQDTGKSDSDDRNPHDTRTSAEAVKNFIRNVHTKYNVKNVSQFVY